MSKLRSVIRHEYLTIVKQPSFWIVMIAIPAIIALIGVLTILGNKNSADRIQEISKDIKNVAIVDQSGLINKDVAAAAELKISPAEKINTLRDKVKSGEKEALIVYPSSLKKDRSYQLYLSSDDLTKMGAISTLADNLLKTSVFLPLGSPEVIAIAQGGATADMTFYKDGRETAGFNEYVVPGLFVVLFYIIFAFSIGYMLTSVSEEKENRSMEMVLTYVQPRTLILGKLLAVMLVTLTQVAFFGLLAILALVVAPHVGVTVALPFGIDLAKLVFDPIAITLGFAFLFTGFLMYAGFMTATAAIAPSAKEANSFSGVFFIGAFIPFYFIYMIATDPENKIVSFLTYFPLTSPVVSLIRNTVGNFNGLEGWIALAVMFAFMLVSIWVAVRAFKLGALEFSQTIKLSSLFKKS
ncbi:ABC transporter permease [Candidatus Saccharibacteria bacterium TM7i]|nr:ABC transporter permease [Candidatus Saccharibacteria bacterium TM7i]